MLKQLPRHHMALLIATVLFIVIAGAWVFEIMGYAPCELCLKQRWAYYLGVPLALLLGVLNPPWLRGGLLLLAIILAANSVFGVYHAGVEWKFWAGPATCGGGMVTGGLPDLTKPAVLCTEAAIRILGLSLAGWNAVICACLAWFAWTASGKNYGSSSVSQ